MTGAPDREYIAARRALLDAREAIGRQRQSAVLVGAQAIYLHTGDDEAIPVSPYTTDADISLDPQLLTAEPLLHEALIAAGFRRSDNPSMVGTWIAPSGVAIDFMVSWCPRQSLVTATAAPTSLLTHAEPREERVGWRVPSSIEIVASSSRLTQLTVAP